MLRKAGSGAAAGAEIVREGAAAGAAGVAVTAGGVEEEGVVVAGAGVDSCAWAQIAVGTSKRKAKKLVRMRRFGKRIK